MSLKISIVIDDGKYVITSEMDGRKCVQGMEKIGSGHWRGLRSPEDEDAEVEAVFGRDDEIDEALDDLGSRCIDIHRAIFG